MAHTAHGRHHARVLLGLLFGAGASIWVVMAAQDKSLEAALPSPWVTACLGLAVVVVGWVLANAAPRFASALAGAAAPGAAFGAVALAGDGARQLAYGWSAVPIALACLALGAGFHGAKHGQKPWSARRSTAPRVPRVRTR